MSPEIVAEMREWLASVVFAGVEPEDFLDPEKFTDQEIVAGIRRHYDGGVQAFIECWQVTR